MLLILISVGYEIIKSHSRSLKERISSATFLYFFFATIESFLRINTTDDQTNDKVIISRIPLFIVDVSIYYYIIMSLIKTMETLRLEKDFVKLNIYRSFTHTLLFAFVAGLLFTVQVLKSYVFTECITNWQSFWV